MPEQNRLEGRKKYKVRCFSFPDVFKNKKGSENSEPFSILKIKSYSAAVSKSASASADTFSPSSLDFSLSAFL